VPVGFDCTKIEELASTSKRTSGRSYYDGVASRRTSGLFLCGLPFFNRHPRRQKNCSSRCMAPGCKLITGRRPLDITQSETFSWANPDNPQQVCVAYNDSRGPKRQSHQHISGISCSTDGGATFTASLAGRQSHFAGTEGDPVLLYNRPHLQWFTVWLDTAAAARLGRL